MNKECMNCTYWIDGCCDNILEDDERYPHNNGELVGLDVHCLDDSGLDIRLRTSPYFGCVQFK